jgi:hypothetical protein
VQGVQPDGDGQVRGGLVPQPEGAAVQQRAQGALEGVVAALTPRPRADTGAAAGRERVTGLPALRAELRVLGGVDGVVGVGAQTGLQGGEQQLPELEVQIAVGEMPT